MKMKAYLLSMIIVAGCALNAKSQTWKGLKDYFIGDFPIGVAVAARDLRDSATRKLILKEFNSLTAENAMKMGPIHPREDLYNWTEADAIVDFAQANHLRVRGHNLCWHSQTPDWIFYDQEKKLVSKELLLQRLKDHIYAVVNRYKGKIYAWDVVNEAVSDAPGQNLRNSLWYQICGDEFITKAFQFAHEADPGAILFYNDYGTEDPAKRERIYNMLKKLVDANVPVDAVGLQAHWSVNDPSPEALINSIKRFSSLGLKVQITELDISIFANDKEIATMATDAQRVARQAAQYAMVFRVFRRYKKEITGVTFWNISDKYSWLDNFPVRGRKNYPLLFDKDLKPKPVYWLIVDE
ncbi:endo-1,4-beta-xylanase [Mucilaginibacter gynuensis]|uniref:Beta-xylanase n=1 Tax=Mucilaginibacter gynuensis TaxID=1302236 RepID=A0ABP8GC83_9SPHI